MGVKGNPRWSAEESVLIAKKMLELQVENPRFKVDTSLLRLAQGVLPSHRQRPEVRWPVGAKQVQRILATGNVAKPGGRATSTKWTGPTLPNVASTPRKNKAKNPPAKLPPPVVKPNLVGLLPPVPNASIPTVASLASAAKLSYEGKTKELLVEVASDFIASVILRAFKKVAASPDVAGLLQLIAPQKELPTKSGIEAGPHAGLGLVPQDYAKEVAVQVIPPNLPKPPKHNPEQLQSTRPTLKKVLICGMKAHTHSELNKFCEGKLHLKFWMDNGSLTLQDKMDWADLVVATMEGVSHEIPQTASAKGKKLVRCTGGTTTIKNALASHFS